MTESMKECEGELKKCEKCLCGLVRQHNSKGYDFFKLFSDTSKRYNIEIRREKSFVINSFILEARACFN